MALAPTSTTSTNTTTGQAPPKLVLDEFISLAVTNTPSELHPFFESFKTLYTKKWVLCFLEKLKFQRKKIMAPIDEEII